MSPEKKNWRKKFQNTEDYRKTRDALKQKLDERAAKRLQLQRDINELERVERVQELNNEINGDLDDIFSQIEIERQKGFQEYIERLSPDNSINGSEEEYHSNTTPEPSRTPTQFNVNASEFKVRPKIKYTYDEGFILSKDSQVVDKILLTNITSLFSTQLAHVIALYI